MSIWTARSIKSYLVGESEKSNSTISAITSEADLKISTPTWIRVSNNKVTEYVEGYDAVKRSDYGVI